MSKKAYLINSFTDNKLNAIVSFATGLIFLALALWFLLSPSSVQVPLAESTPVSKAQLSTSPLRQTLSDPPLTIINGFTRNCMDCHQIFASSTASQQPYQHENITLDHGINDHCLNCHHIDDRDKLTLRSGKKILFSQSQLVCAQCHGTTYRDWQQGTHGKSIGYWNEQVGQKTKFICTQCHNPHAPAFKPLVPLPGPNTLRMGDQQHYLEIEHTGTRNPLRLTPTTPAEKQSH